MIGVAYIVGGGVSNMAKGSSASGTSIPIVKGGTGAVTREGALVNLLPEFENDDGKVLGLSGGAPAWVNQAKSEATIMTPDYAKIESTNRITDTNQSWTVVSTGFIYVRIFNTIVDNAVIRVNNGQVMNIAGSFYYTPFTGIFPVKAGDIVSSTGLAASADGTNRTAYSVQFIPPVYSTPPTPIVVEGGDYAYSEQPVMVNDNGTLRQQTYADGKPIYRQSFKGNIVVGANTSAQITLIPNMSGDIVSYGGWVNNGTGNHLSVIAAQGSTSLVRSMLYKYAGSNDLIFQTVSTYDRSTGTDNDYDIWVEYTKAVD
jgi:hypothetical protein